MFLYRKKRTWKICTINTWKGITANIFRNRTILKNSTLGLLSITFPKADVRSNLGIEYHDTGGNLIGYVDQDTFYLNTDYEHYDMAKSALIENGVNWQDWDEARTLYGWLQRLQSLTSLHDSGAVVGFGWLIYMILQFKTIILIIFRYGKTNKKNTGTAW